MDDLIGGVCEAVGDGIGKCAGWVGDVIEGTVDLITSAVGDGQSKSQPQANQLTNSKDTKDRELVRETERQQTAINRWIHNPDRGFAAPCGCLGPREGQPACPCDMRERYVEVDGYYYEVYRDVVNGEAVLKATNRGLVKGEQDGF